LRIPHFRIPPHDLGRSVVWLCPNMGYTKSIHVLMISFVSSNRMLFLWNPCSARPRSPPRLLSSIKATCTLWTLWSWRETGCWFHSPGWKDCISKVSNTYDNILSKVGSFLSHPKLCS
jgi:hypothetical protein